MKIRAFVCPRCGDKIFSRARHDLRYCGCFLLAVNGGFDYTKMSMDVDWRGPLPQSVEIKVKATREELYEDWNTGKGEFGVIKGDS